MNKFIEYDIHNGTSLLRCAVFNVIDALESGEITSYTFECDIIKLFIDCLELKGYTVFRNDLQFIARKSIAAIHINTDILGKTFINYASAN